MLDYEEENGFVYAVLLDSSPLELWPKSPKNSMSFDVRLSNLVNCNNEHLFHIMCLVDSGCTALAFVDEELIVKCFKIRPKPLVKLHSVRLADGSCHATVSQ